MTRPLQFFLLQKLVILALGLAWFTVVAYTSSVYTILSILLLPLMWGILQPLHAGKCPRKVDQLAIQQPDQKSALRKARRMLPPTVVISVSVVCLLSLLNYAALITVHNLSALAATIVVVGVMFPFFYSLGETSCLQLARKIAKK